jgi:hypothetical protein
MGKEIKRRASTIRRELRHSGAVSVRGLTAIEPLKNWQAASASMKYLK